MTYLAPLTDEQKRKLRAGTMKPGEHLSFDIAFADAAPRAGSAVYFTDAAIAAEVARAESLHHRQFAYLGSKAPKFNRDAAAIAARDRLANIAQAADRSRALAAARYQDGANLADAVTDARNQRSYALRNAYSASRYSGS
jgi:hypothetical protein